MAAPAAEGEPHEREKKEAMASPVEVLKKATSSKANFLLFALNPKNAMFMGLSTIALIATLYVFVHAGWKSLRNGPGTRTDFAVFVLIGLWGGTISTLFQVTIQESIDRFRALNNRLEKEVEMLGTEVEGLEATSEQLESQLKEFDGIRKEMEACAEAAGVQFQDFFKQTNDIFGSMSSVQKQQDMALLEKAAADIEFLDSSAGMSFTEFKRFCKTVPSKFREKLSDASEEKFKSVAGDDGVISVDELRAFLHAFVEECGNPQAGEP
mmetsp:Transcript_73232/g.177028  ORF Transcript_73232/g.177028 Transcript_73232/m.177028 type:complete len:267 (+) Transcript_73232:41-841(+)